MNSFFLKETQTKIPKVFLPQLIAITLTGLFYLLTLTEGLRKSGGLMRLPPHRFPPPSHSSSPFRLLEWTSPTTRLLTNPAAPESRSWNRKTPPLLSSLQKKVSRTQKKSFSVFYFKGVLRPLKFAVKL